MCLRNWRQALLVLSLSTALTLFSGVIARAAEKGLVAYYSFDKVAGSVVSDESGAGNNGKLNGGVKWVKGDFGGALELDGVNGYVDCGTKESLDISKAGTILVWYKPVSQCQGGLVCWTKGSGDNNQRLVISLNTYTATDGRGTRQHKELGLYMSDGQNIIRPVTSNYLGPYFPQADKWEFYALTFNGTSINVYKDGVLMFSRFQALVPDTKDVPLWLGRCVGKGGPSDYFKGLIDEVKIYDHSLTDSEIYDFYMKTAKGRDKNISNFDSIGIKPVINNKAGIVFADLNYRGLFPVTQNIKIKAELLDNQKKVISSGKIKISPAWGQAEVTFDVANLAAGNYTLKVFADKGKPNEVTVNWPGRAEGWSKVKVLNNLCWELLNESPGKNFKDKYTFTTPRNGWLYFVTEADGTLTLSVEDSKPPSIHLPGKETKQEAMRWLEKGEHTIIVSGNGELKKLIVRSVPILAFCHYPHVGPGIGNEHEFWVKYVLPHVNTIITGNYGPEYNTGNFRTRWTDDMGGQSIETLYSAVECQPKLTDDNAKESIYKYIAESAGMNNPDFSGVMLDEFDAGNEQMMWYKSYYDKWIESVSRIMEDPKFSGRKIIPYFGNKMYDFEKSSAFLKAFVKYDSYLAYEDYLEEKETEGEAYVYINETLADNAGDWERAIPGAIEHMIITLSILERENWNPDVDFNVYLDMQFNNLATRPELFGLAGISDFGSHQSNEECVRWLAKLCRHYGLEGQTERLNNDPYILPHIKNGDFNNGTEGWEIRMAKKDSMAVKNQKGYGLLSGLYATHYSFTDTYVLWTKRCEDKPNVFSQEIRDLQPGKLYSVKVVTGDYQELIEGKSVKQKYDISVKIDNSDLYDDWYRTPFVKKNTEYYKSWNSVGKFSSDNRYNMNIHHQVFRAKGKTAKLTITDWKSDTEPGGSIGQELIFDSIQVQPYLEYDE